MGTKSSQRMFLVSVAGISGYFMTKSGGEVSAEVTRIFPGGSMQADVLSSIPTVDDLVVSRAYDPSYDAVLLKNLRALVGIWTTTVTVTPTNASMVALDNPTVYSGCLLTKLAEPEYDSSSGDAAMFELTFAVSSVR